jgi:colanic acid/amylovoran biosynthesis glycosyltransferase
MGSWNAPSERFLKRQIRMLSEAGALECIVAARLCGNDKWDNVPVYGLAREVVPCEQRVSPNKEHQVRRLKTIIQSTTANTILCQYGTIAALFASDLETAPQRLFIHVHGKDTFEQMHAPGYKDILIRLMSRSYVICNPYTYHRMLNWGIGPDNLFVKRYGVEIPDSPFTRTVSEEVTILHLGRLVDFKSPDRTIQAFDLACDRGLRGNLIIAGDGPLRRRCEELRLRSRWRDNIRMVGFVSTEQAQALYLQADIFTQHANIGEEFGQVETYGVSIVEAMAAALPVVTCSSGGITDNVIDGQTGILCPPGNFEAQAAAFVTLFQDRKVAREMGCAGWRRAKAHFSYEQEKERLLSILQVP